MENEDNDRFREIDINIVNELRIRKVKWIDVCKDLKMSKSKVNEWRRRINYKDPLLKPTPNVLDTVVSSYCVGYSNRGEREAWGHVQGLDVTRDELRASINRVDSEGRERRRCIYIKRVEYSVPGPHHLWHFDGCHRLIQYGFVVHGCIDGFSRSIMYLHCSNNNRANTVLELFKSATAIHGIPSRARCDHGTENIRVAEYMIEQRGVGRGSIITGTSMRNQRIERLWRDVTSSVLIFYKEYFLWLENHIGLNLSNNGVRFILHYLFLPRINDELKRFKEGWEHHPMSSICGNYSPSQLIYLNRHIAGNIVVPVDTIDEETFGVYEDEEGVHVDASNVIPSTVVVDPTTNPFGDLKLQQFQQQVEPISMETKRDSFWDIIVHALNVMENLLHE